MALKVNEIVKVEVEASDGQVLKEGDAIMLRINRRTRRTSSADTRGFQTVTLLPLPWTGSTKTNTARRVLKPVTVLRT